MKRTYAFALMAALLLFSLPAAAQTFGEITGTVTDTTGAVIAGAKVIVTNESTNAAREVESNEVGAYNVPFLNPGVYTIQAEVEGFNAARVTGRILEVGATQQVDIALEIGVVTEVVEVQAGAQMLNTRDTALGQVIDQQRIVDLPINGRNYLNLVKLSTNVTAEMGSGGQANSRQGGERANQSISIAGQRQMFNRFTLDGVENTDPNFNTFVVRPSVDALQEFKVQTGVYSAEYGKATSQINVTTRAGSNEFHGTVFEFLRNDKIQARTWNQHGDKDPFRRNQFGFTVTGPIVKNKLFFMANYEGFRERRSGFAQSTVADQAMRNGDFSDPTLTRRSTIRTRFAPTRTTPGCSRLIRSRTLSSRWTAISVRSSSCSSSTLCQTSVRPDAWATASTGTATRRSRWTGISSRPASTSTRAPTRSGSAATRGATSW